MAPQRFLVVRDTAPDDTLRGAVVAIGNFDGVHRGHRAVIAVARDCAAVRGSPAAVLTFEPHPRVFFHPREGLFRLTDEAVKLRLLAATGLDGAIVLTFDAALARLTAEEFVARILVERFAVSGVVIGFNFHFGAGRTGSPAFLEAQGAQRGFTVDIVAPLEDGGRPVASGPIRDALAAGRVGDAADLLGYRLVRLRHRRARRQARAGPRFPDREHRARPALRPAPRRLRGARATRRPPL